jgi:hypothetical protein
MITSFQEYFKQIDFDSWTEFKSKIDSFPLEWIYRGQASADWILSSSLERSSLIEINHDIENILIDEYRRAIHSFLPQMEIPTTILEWLYLLQHYGTPTRLIDFTKSPYVGAFFAFEEDHDDQSGRVAIWCLNKIKFYQAAVYHLKNGFDDFDISKWVNRNYFFSNLAFDAVFKKNALDCVMPFDPPNSNKRYLAQQSVFLAAGNSEKKLVEQLEFLNYQEKPLMTKITMPRRIRKAVIRDLFKMNISPATLFPGIDGFARALNLKYSTIAGFGEIGEWTKDLKEDGFVL